ncbi:MAG: S-adenosylmethionine:tRNA ribosyltransferase-isomerase [Bacteroidetes bacterium]|nr:S-adenosylmethionine:tRNA ribosyltransferase-isomerase [Bacteroidota bacterium]
MPIPVIATSDYDYDLPSERIAKHPLSQRDESKLLIALDETIEVDFYKNIVDYLPERSLMVFNNSKVIPARILYVKDTGGIIELFCLEPIEGTPYEALQDTQKSTWLCMVGGAKKWKQDLELHWQLNDSQQMTAKMLNKNEQTCTIEFSWQDTQTTFADILEQLGQMPIPPYLLRKAEASDKQQYQTVYAKVEGSVAAPTAGLHFTESVFQSFSQKNISTNFTTLHVGAGTFKPVSAEFIHDHAMHAEWVDIDIDLIEQLSKANDIVCVGTTSLRTLESLYWFALENLHVSSLPNKDYVLSQFTPYKFEGEKLKKTIVFKSLVEKMRLLYTTKLIFRTELMIMPGYQLQVANYLVTNFHQPKSTLLMLVDAFTKGRWKSIYHYALKNDFRFLSYGDGCLLHYS